MRRHFKGGWWGRGWGSRGLGEWMAYIYTDKIHCMEVPHPLISLFRYDKYNNNNNIFRTE